MLPIDAFMAEITSPLAEDDDQDENFDALYLAVGQKAKDNISRIVAEGAEQVLDEILRDSPELDRVTTSMMPEENNHERLDDENHVIFWSKSGVEPFVGIYQKSNPNGPDIQMAGEPEMFEEPIKEIDMEALEAAGHFLLRGTNEDTVSRVITDACKGCSGTDEALTKLREIITDDKYLSGTSYNDDEIEGLNEYRRDVRKRFMSCRQSEVLNQSLYESDVEQLNKDKEKTREKQAELAKDKADNAKLQAKIADEMADNAEDLGDSLTEGNTDPNKNSQIVGYQDVRGPEKLGAAIAAMDWTGRGGEFDKLLHDIEMSGFNLIGNAGEAQAGQQPAGAQANPQAQATPQAAPVPQAPQAGQELGAMKVPEDPESTIGDITTG